MHPSNRHDILFLRMIAVISLILWHAAPHQLDNLPRWFGFYVNKFYLGVPLFFCISGFLWIMKGKKNEEATVTNILKKKAQRLLLPYICLGSAVFLPKIALNAYTYNPLDKSFLGFLSSFFYPATNAIRFLWFLPCLYILFLIAIVFFKKRMSSSGLLVSYILSILLFLFTEKVSIPFDRDPLCIITALNNVHYFVLGMLLHRFSHLMKSRPVLIGVLIIFHIALVARFTLPEELVPSDTINTIYYSIYIIVLYRLSEKLGPKITHRPFWHDIGYYSYPIFIFSWFVLVALRIFLYDRQELSPIGINAAILTSFVCGLLIPLYISRFMDKALSPKLKPLVGL